MTFKWSADSEGPGCDILVECWSYKAAVLRKYTKVFSSAARYISPFVVLEHAKKRAQVDPRVKYSVKFKMMMKTHVCSSLGNWEV